MSKFTVDKLLSVCRWGWEFSNKLDNLTSNNCTQQKWLIFTSISGFVNHLNFASHAWLTLPMVMNGKQVDFHRNFELSMEKQRHRCMYSHSTHAKSGVPGHFIFGQ